MVIGAYGFDLRPPGERGALIGRGGFPAVLRWGGLTDMLGYHFLAGRSP